MAIFITRKHLWWSFFLIKLQTLRPATLLKRDSNTVVFLWILQNLKNIYFEDHLQTAASASWSILYKEFNLREVSIWLQLIYFLTTIAFWPMKYLFRIFCVVFMAQYTHYKKFTALHKLISTVLELTSQIN